MPRALPTRKRPCRICRRWFLPNPRLKSRQMTCGDARCKTEWHRKKCAEWNRRNPDYFKANYLQKRLEAAGQGVGTSKIPTAKSSPGKTLKSRMKLSLFLLNCSRFGWQREEIEARHYSNIRSKLHQSIFIIISINSISSSTLN